MKVFIRIAVYGLCWFLSTGAVLADLQLDDSDQSWRRSSYRDALGFAAFMSLIPPVWVICPFVTGFFEHGWVNVFTYRPENFKEGE